MGHGSVKVRAWWLDPTEAELGWEPEAFLRRMEGDGFYGRVRCGGGGGGARGVRGRDGGGAHGAEDCAVHAEPGPDCADELQSGDWRDCQGTSGARGGRAGRRDGRGGRCVRDPVPAAEYEQGAGGVVAEGTVRQGALPREDARGAGGAAGAVYQAGGG